MMGLWQLPLMFAKGFGASLRKAEETVLSVVLSELAIFLVVLVTSTSGVLPVLGIVRLRSCSLMLLEFAMLGGVLGTFCFTEAVPIFLVLRLRTSMVSLACRMGLGRFMPAVSDSAFAVPCRVETIPPTLCLGSSLSHR